MERAAVILTDSGGVQEEATSRGTPALVVRDSTERRDGIQSGNAKMAGTRRESIAASIIELFDYPAALAEMTTRHNPYGDGHPAQRIVDALASRTSHGGNSSS